MYARQSVSQWDGEDKKLKGYWQEKYGTVPTKMPFLDKCNQSKKKSK